MGPDVLFGLVLAGVHLEESEFSSPGVDEVEVGLDLEDGVFAERDEGFTSDAACEPAVAS